MTTIPNLNPIPSVTGDDYLITHDSGTNRSGRVSAETLKDFISNRMLLDGDITAANVSYETSSVEEYLDNLTSVYDKRYVEKVTISSFGAVNGADNTAAIQAAVNSVQGTGRKLIFDVSGTITAPIAVADSIWIDSENFYDEFGTNGIKYSINLPSTNNFAFYCTQPNMSLNISNIWFHSLVGYAASCTAKVSSFNRLRLTGSKGIKLDNTYICYVDDLECYCTDRGLEIVGDCSPTIRGGNYGAGNATYGAIYISTRAGKTSISGSYLESQANPTVVANGCLDSAIFIYDYYDENATTGCIKVVDSQTVHIDKVRTNTNTNAVVVSGNSVVHIAGIVPVDRIENGKCVDIVGDSPVVTIAGLTHAYRTGSTPDNRDYSIVSGIISGPRVKSTSIYGQFNFSANNTTSIIGGTISSSVPTGKLLQNRKSLLLTPGQSLKIPTVGWRSNSTYVVQIIYKCESPGENDVNITFNTAPSTVHQELQYWHSPTAAFVCKTLMFFSGSYSMGQYSNMRVNLSASATDNATIHFIALSEYGGVLPFGAYNPTEVVYESGVIDLSTTTSRAVLVPSYETLNSSREGRIVKWELVNYGSTNTGGSAAVSVSVTNSSNARTSDLVVFTTGVLAAGGACPTVTDTGPYPYSEHQVESLRGLHCFVTSSTAGVGQARVIAHVV